MGKKFVEMNDDTFLEIWRELDAKRGRLLIFGKDLMGWNGSASFQLFHEVEITSPSYLCNPTEPLDLTKNRDYSLRQPFVAVDYGDHTKGTRVDTNQCNVGNYLFEVSPLFIRGRGLFDKNGETLFIPEGVSARDAFAYAIINQVARINEVMEGRKETGLGKKEVSQMVEWVMKDLRHGRKVRNERFWRAG